MRCPEELALISTGSGTNLRTGMNGVKQIACLGLCILPFAGFGERINQEGRILGQPPVATNSSLAVPHSCISRCIFSGTRGLVARKYTKPRM